MMMRNLKRIVLATMLASAIVQPVMATCTMQTQMANAQAAEQARRLGNINTNLQTLALLSQLQSACLQGFQMIPTQGMVPSAIAITALTNIEQSVCQSLVNKARSTAQSAMAAAQAQVQQQINSITSSVVSSSASSGMLSGATQTSTSSSGGGVVSAITNSLSRLFQ
jgi:ERCC4-type nuclease